MHCLLLIDSQYLILQLRLSIGVRSAFFLYSDLGFPDMEWMNCSFTELPMNCYYVHMEVIDHIAILYIHRFLYIRESNRSFSLVWETASFLDNDLVYFFVPKYQVNEWWRSVSLFTWRLLPTLQFFIFINSDILGSPTELFHWCEKQLLFLTMILVHSVSQISSE